jgi:hypothetical protein
VHMGFAGLEVSGSKALQVSGIHRPTIRVTVATARLGRRRTDASTCR